MQLLHSALLLVTNLTAWSTHLVGPGDLLVCISRLKTTFAAQLQHTQSQHLLASASAPSCSLLCTTAYSLTRQATPSSLPTGMVAHSCQELAASAVQGVATGAVFMYGALVASTVQTAHVVRKGARLYVFYVAAGTEWVWATTYATVESAFTALRTATLMVGFTVGWRCIHVAYRCHMLCSVLGCSSCVAGSTPARPGLAVLSSSHRGPICSTGSAARWLALDCAQQSECSSCLAVWHGASAPRARSI